MYCGNCGKELSDQAVACPHCSSLTARGRAGPAASLRPLSIGEILEAAIKTYRDHAATLLSAVAIVVVPVGLLTVAIRLATLSTSGSLVVDDAIDGGAVVSFIVVSVATAVLGVVATQVATAAALKGVGDAYLGYRPEPGPTVRFALDRIGSVLWVLVLSGAVFVGVMIAAVAPGALLAPAAGVVAVLPISLGLLVGFVVVAWLYVRWSVAVPSLLIEGQRGWSALERSAELVRGMFWPVFGVLVVGWIVTQVASAIIAAVFLVPFSLAGESAASVFVQGVATTVAQVLTLPFVAAVVGIVYFDLRVRAGGLDLDLIAFGLNREPPLEPPNPA